MTPDQLALVQRSFASVGDRSDDLAATFYRQLFELDPEARSMFEPDLEAQRQKLIDELGAIVGAVTDLDALAARAEPLGARHAGYGVQPYHYELVRDALLSAMAEVLGDDWDDATEDAWIYAYDLVAEVMLQGAAAAGRHPTTG